MSCIEVLLCIESDLLSSNVPNSGNLRIYRIAYVAYVYTVYLKLLCRSTKELQTHLQSAGSLHHIVHFRIGPLFCLAEHSAFEVGIRQ